MDAVFIDTEDHAVTMGKSASLQRPYYLIPAPGSTVQKPCQYSRERKVKSGNMTFMERILVEQYMDIHVNNKKAQKLCVRSIASVNLETVN